jgi:hypothetical protein
MDVVLTVYLDQNKWIDLARAETGHPKGAPFTNVLASFKQAAQDGRARFPLSCAHYYESGKKANPKKRMELVTTMVRLSGVLRIAPPQAIVPWEIRRALVAVFDLTSPVADLGLFGPGVAHAFASPSLRYKAPAEWKGIVLPKAWQEVLQQRCEAEFEARVLADVMPEGVPEVVRFRLHEYKNLTNERFVEGQRAVAAWVAENGRHRLEEIMLATAFVDISEPLALAAAELGITGHQLADNASAIIEAMPSRWVEMKLRRQRQANPQKTWEGNDLNDVTALAIAVPYCDVVVTEKSWASHVTAANAGERFGTLVTSSLLEVADRLAVTSDQFARPAGSCS